MSKHKILDSITNEIHNINDRIDRMIIEGRPYNGLAKRHKMLVKRLKEVNQKSWGRSFSFFSFL
ncbi:MAG: hypothetical protein WCI52_02100 [bacterium]